MRISTGRISEPGALDITIKSAKGFGRQLAPTWELVGGHKRWASEQRGEEPPLWTLKYPAIDDEWYRDRYVAILRERYAKNAGEWHDYLRKHPEITLGCYCTMGKFCHRDIAAEVLTKVARHIGLRVE